MVHHPLVQMSSTILTPQTLLWHQFQVIFLSLVNWFGKVVFLLWSVPSYCAVTFGRFSIKRSTIEIELKSINWSELDRVNFSTVSFNSAVNYNRFVKEIQKKIHSGCKYMTKVLYHTIADITKSEKQLTRPINLSSITTYTQNCLSYVLIKRHIMTNYMHSLFEQ